MDSEAHLRAIISPELELIEATEQKEPPPMLDMTFTREDYRGVPYPHSDPLVMVVYIIEQSVHRVLLDCSTKLNVIYKSCWDHMHLEDKTRKRSSTPIVQ